MKLLTEMTVDLGGAEARTPNTEHTTTLTPPPVRGVVGVSAELTGQGAGPPLLELFDGTQRLAQGRGFQAPLSVSLPSARPIQARVSWPGWASNVDLRVRFFSGAPPAVPLELADGQSLALASGQLAAFTLAEGHGSSVLAQGGTLRLFRDGQALPPVQPAKPLSLSGPGRFTFEVEGAPVTLRRADLALAPAEPPAPPEPLPTDLSDPLPFTAGVSQRYALEVPPGSLVELRVAAEAGSARACLLSASGDVLAQAEGAGPQVLTLGGATGPSVLKLSTDQTTDVTLELEVAVPAEPGEYVISSSGASYGYLLRDVPQGQRVSVAVSRRAGAPDRPALRIEARAPRTVLARSGYHAGLEAVSPGGDLIVRAAYQDTPYTDVTVFIALSPP